MPYFAARNFCSELGNTGGQFLPGQQLRRQRRVQLVTARMTEYQFSRGDRSFFAMPDDRIVMMSGDVVSSYQLIRGPRISPAGGRPVARTLALE